MIQSLSIFHMEYGMFQKFHFDEKLRLSEVIFLIVS